MKIGTFVTPIIEDDLLIQYGTYIVMHVDIYKRLTVKAIHSDKAIDKKFVQSRFIVIDNVEMAMILA